MNSTTNSTSNKLETEYGGARLSLEIGPGPRAALKVNGLVRERGEATSAATTLRLTSTVQTDYEWHEFIEGIVDFDAQGTRARLVANKQEIAAVQFSRAEGG